MGSESLDPQSNSHNTNIHSGAVQEMGTKTTSVSFSLQGQGLWPQATDTWNGF